MGKYLLYNRLLFKQYLNSKLLLHALSNIVQASILTFSDIVHNSRDSLRLRRKRCVNVFLSL